MSHAEAGSVREEALRLVEALAQWAAGASEHVSERAGSDASDCRLCPVCSLIGLLRTTRPETYEHLLDATASLSAALRSALAAHEQHWAARRSGPVERIDLD